MTIPEQEYPIPLTDKQKEYSDPAHGYKALHSISKAFANMRANGIQLPEGLEQHALEEIMKKHGLSGTEDPETSSG